MKMGDLAATRPPLLDTGPMTDLLTFAQHGGDSLFFRILLIPLGLWITFIGVLAIRQRRIYFRKWHFTLHGIPAVLLGGIVAVLGIGIVLGMFASFLGL